MWSSGECLHAIRELLTPLQIRHSNDLLYEAMQDESTELCFISVAHIVCYIIPWKIWYRKYCSVYIAINRLKYRLHSCTTGNIACGCGLEANIALGFASCYISLRPNPCAIFPVVHSLRYFYSYKQDFGLVYWGLDTNILLCGMGWGGSFVSMLLWEWFSC